jgi:hypothetical protein
MPKRAVKKFQPMLCFPPCGHRLGNERKTGAGEIRGHPDKA